jgi:arginyl-tRNA synthetase
VKRELQKILNASLRKALDNGQLSPTEGLQGIVEGSQETISRPTNPDFGDYTSNLAMVLASEQGKPPRAIAETVLDNLEDHEDFLSRAEIAGPGFMNFTINPRRWLRTLKQILKDGEAFGSSEAGSGVKVQIEFVSANPTGPLHVGHGRGAAVGDVLANLLMKTGFEVQKEYYINDLGNQIDLLGESVYARYCEALGAGADFPEDGYQGEYIKQIARDLVLKRGDALTKLPHEEAVSQLSGYTKDLILARIEEDLKDFGVVFDRWFSERSLYDGREENEMLERLADADLIYEKEGAVWFRATSLGDEKDWVVVRSGGQFTYFASDILYLKNKFDRGFHHLINIWGADHHGYVPRVKAVLKALGYSPQAFDVLLVQFVQLISGGERVGMSTRKGEFITLSEVVKEVGKDAARFWFLTKSSDAHLDFDLDLAKKESKENPVYYVQYAHARICSVLRLAEEKGVVSPEPERVDLSPLTLDQELELVKQLMSYPEILESAALQHKPHLLTYYVQELARLFHSYYNMGNEDPQLRVLTEDEAVTAARLLLCLAVKSVLGNALRILGVSAPERM